ncbi:MAG TPA: hypothetical protein VMT44_00465 [Methanoregula sp.]|nr:hypothetical protein [Methanoregula sp.]
MKIQIPLIITIIMMLVIVIGVYLGLSYVITQKENITTVNQSLVNPYTLTEKTSPAEISKQLNRMFFHFKFGINKWEFGPDANEITLHIYDIHNESQVEELQGARLDNYSIRLIHDTEFEKTRQAVEDNLIRLRNNTQLQISFIDMDTDPFGDPPEYTAEVWVSNLTPENRNLDNTMINGWRIHVYKAS